MSKEKILTCPHCGCDEFMAPAAAHDFFRFVNGVPQMVGTKMHAGGNDGDSLICAKCLEDAPQSAKDAL